MKTYYYTNSWGFHKMLDIQETPNAEGKYYCMLWETSHGEFCGSAWLTKEEIKEYFHNNHIEGEF